MDKTLHLLIGGTRSRNNATRGGNILDRLSSQRTSLNHNSSNVAVDANDARDDQPQLQDNNLMETELLYFEEEIDDVHLRRINQRAFRRNFEVDVDANNSDYEGDERDHNDSDIEFDGANNNNEVFYDEEYAVPAHVHDDMLNFQYPNVVPSYSINPKIDQIIANRLVLEAKLKDAADPLVCAGGDMSRAEFAGRLKSIQQRHKCSPVIIDDIMELLIEGLHHHPDIELPVRQTQRNFIRSNVDDYDAANGMDTVISLQLCEKGNCFDNCRNGLHNINPVMFFRMHNL